MKKLTSLVCIVILFATLSGCALLLGGANKRELGEFIPLYTDGVSDYFEYDLTFEEGLIKKTAEGFTLSELSTNDEAISIKETPTKVIFKSYITALGGYGDCADGYEYLYEALDSAFDIYGDDVFSEALILENQGQFYGAVNFYSRPSGRSGSLLTNENIVKGTYFTVTDGKVNVIKELEKTAVLAFNQTHLITYKNKKINSLNLDSGEETFLLKDKAWDKGPSFYNNFRVSFTDESFLIYTEVDDNFEAGKETVIVANFDGTCLATLVDNKEIEY